MNHEVTEQAKDTGRSLILLATYQWNPAFIPGQNILNKCFGQEIAVRCAFGGKFSTAVQNITTIPTFCTSSDENAALLVQAIEASITKYIGCRNIFDTSSFETHNLRNASKFQEEYITALEPVVAQMQKDQELIIKHDKLLSDLKDLSHNIAESEGLRITEDITEGTITAAFFLQDRFLGEITLLINPYLHENMRGKRMFYIRRTLTETKKPVIFTMPGVSGEGVSIPNAAEMGIFNGMVSKVKYIQKNIELTEKGPSFQLNKPKY